MSEKLLFVVAKITVPKLNIYIKKFFKEIQNLKLCHSYTEYKSNPPNDSYVVHRIQETLLHISQPSLTHLFPLNVQSSFQYQLYNALPDTY